MLDISRYCNHFTSRARTFLEVCVSLIVTNISRCGTSVHYIVVIKKPKKHVDNAWL